MPTRVVAALCLAVVVAACGRPLDTDSVETQVATQMASQLGGEWTVECPDRVEPEEGHRFRCTAESDGDGVEVLVTQEDAEGSLTWRIVE